MSREAMQQALEALDAGVPISPGSVLHDSIRAALAEQKKPMPITDDYGEALLPQYRVIEQRGNWRLLYDQHVVGEKARHEFRIVKIPHDILLYPGISLEEAKRRFEEIIENDYE